MTGLLGLAVAFLGGIVSFASPCCLPLVPAYVSYMVGTTAEADRRRTFLHGLAFVAGFSAVFVAFWASIGLVGYLLAGNVRIIRQAGGALLIFLGLHTAGVIDVPALWRDLRPLPAFAGAGGGFGAPGGSGQTAAQSGYGRSLAFGSLFAAGWSPCIGPILGAIIGLASASESVGQGTLLLVAYSAGLAVPFLAVALGATAVSRRLTWVSRHHHAVSVVTGALLVAIGGLMVTNLLGRLATFTSPLGL
ncbi:MAG TPA: cytochrome c biogenesis protein CcdA [Candidatus Limnocylindrales bacterium]